MPEQVRRPYRAFVSSTYEDLREHRAHVVDSLRKAGFYVDPMEDWTATSEEPKRFSAGRVVGSDLCVLLVGWRRGHIPDGDELSVTQREVQTAREHDIDVLAYLLPEDALWRRQFDELDRDEALRAWRRELETGLGVGYFDHEPTSIAIGPALTRWVTDRVRDGASALRSHLDAGGYTATDIALGTAHLDNAHELEPTLDDLRTGIQVAAQDPASQLDAAIHLDLGRALAANGRWEDAVEHYDAYLDEHPDDWEAHFLRGVSLANQRKDDASNIAALRAYGDAIALAPAEVEPRLAARLHIYRGAMFKRLDRWDEAESEFVLGRRWAETDYEIEDVLYNLASLHALKKDRAGMLEYLAEMDPLRRSRLGRHPYFREYWDDEAFRALVASY